MNRLFILLTTFLLLASLHSSSQKIIPEKPLSIINELPVDSIPESEINIPIQINLKPIYALMEKSIDTVFTSPNWPNEWIQEDCATRYKYKFRRSPLQLNAYANVLDLSFTGYYQLIGSSRICMGNRYYSPWTPECRCGYDNDEKRVAVKFTNSVSFSKDLKMKITMNILEPEAIDACKVCFWDQDITKLVMKGMKAELDLAKKEIEKSISLIDLRPYLQDVWNALDSNYNLYETGWLNINPSQIKITHFFAKNDSLNIFIGLKAKPVISLEYHPKQNSIVPNLSDHKFGKGFNINLDARLNYDSLSNLITERIRNNRFDFSKGPFRKYVIIDKISVQGLNNEELLIKVDFSGSNSGEFYVTGKPVYDSKLQKLEMKNLDFEIKTKALLLKTAGWMMNRKILKAIKDYAEIDLSIYMATAKSKIVSILNTELMTGINSSCTLENIELTTIKPFSNYLFIRSKFSGAFSLKVDPMNLIL